MNALFFVNSILFGVGLAMDACSVSCANALRQPDMQARRMTQIAGVFALFQFLMPMAGWLCVHSVKEYFAAVQGAIPWIALALLLWIGGGMLRSGIRGQKAAPEGAVRGGEIQEGTSRGGEVRSGEIQEGTSRGGEVRAEPLTAAMLLVQGIATSIDALSVGFTIAGYDAAMAFASCLIIAAVTFVVCMGALAIGKRAGRMLSGKADILGGVILIAIGIEIVVTQISP